MSDPVAASEPTGEHDPHVHHFPDGLEEGNARVPAFIIALAIGLAIFFVYYVVNFITGVQPNAADFKS